MRIPVKRIGNHSLPLPKYETAGAVGMDLRICLPNRDPVDGEAWDTFHLNAGSTFRLPTGFAFAIPEGFEGQVRPRSSISARGLHVALGTIDSDYTGQVCVIVTAGRSDVELKNGERIAQLVIAPVARAELVEVDTLSETARGAGGFGSTGTGSGEVAP